ncbi:DUF615 domain-containing protein [Thiotrichales bacterium 19S11-10]|nr:DUF615 domain-containing protein [Thiotrichales bacterium 19S11-10]MCF6807228.1 DUF615 domain-containing protein [Thiotrichales bacterium 19S9-11]MCF6811197.1 DUF615 domain-containing protein [Thiotrichales bacterium 19S9-12]
MTKKEEDNLDSTKSKTQVKKELLEITKLGEMLIRESIEVLKKLPLETMIFDAICDAKKMKHIALKRQIGYIGKLLRNSNADEIKAVFDEIKQVEGKIDFLFHQTESWRERLISHNQKLELEAFFNQFPHADRQMIRQLAKKAKLELEKNPENKKVYRMLFQEIKLLLTAEDTLNNLE